MKKLMLAAALACITLTTTMAQTLPIYVPTNGLIGYWGFTGNANDYSVKANNGAVYGAVLVQDRYGNANNAYQFGSGQRIAIPDANYLDGMTTGLSFSFWVKVSPGAYSNILISKSTGCQTNGDDAYAVYVMSNGKVRVQYADNNGNNYNQDGSVVVADNNWHHIAAVWSNAQTKIYVDGVVDIATINNAFSGPIRPSNSTLDFGHATIACAVPWSYNEVLDDICLFDRALTPAEVSVLYIGCTGAPTATSIAIGNTTFCAGGDVLLKCNTTAPGVSYQWKKGANNINGATSNTYSATATGTYKCIVTNTCGTATSNGILVTSNANTAVTLSASGNTAFCAGDSVTINASNPGANYSLQWYRNNISISNATALSYTTHQPGVFKVVSKNTTNGCSRINTSSVTTTVNCRMANPSQRAGNIEDQSAVFNPVKLYPNPNAGSFTFEYSGLIEDETGKATIQLLNSTGQKVYEFSVDVNNGRISKEINLDGMVKGGIYLLKMEINNQVYSSKVMIN